jgi:hypothetical protein
VSDAFRKVVRVQYVVLCNGAGACCRYRSCEVLHGGTALCGGSAITLNVRVCQLRASSNVPAVRCFSLAANADIFFDATLHRLSGSENRALPQLHATRTVLALLKWAYFAEDETISLHVRTDSQGKCCSSTPALHLCTGSERATCVVPRLHCYNSLCGVC